MQKFVNLFNLENVALEFPSPSIVETNNTFTEDFSFYAPEND